MNLKFAYFVAIGFLLPFPALLLFSFIYGTKAGWYVMYFLFLGAVYWPFLALYLLFWLYSLSVIFQHEKEKELQKKSDEFRKNIEEREKEFDAKIKEK